MPASIAAPNSGGSVTNPTGGSNPIVSSGAALLAVLAAGALLVILADPFPTFVNGLLILILVGAVIQSSGTWTTWLQAAAKSFKA